MSTATHPFRIWTYCNIADLRPKLAAAGCQIVQEPVSKEPTVRKVKRTGLKVMFLPRFVVRVAPQDGESEDAARARVYDAVNAGETEQDAREQAEAERRADARLSNVLNHAIKVQWVLRRANKADEEFVTLELRRPSPREKRLFEDESGAAAEYEAEEVAEAPDNHLKYRVTMRPL